LSQDVKSIVDSSKQKLNAPERFEQLHQYACNPENFWPQVREKMKQIPLAFKQIQESGDLQWVDSVFFVSDAPGKNDGSHGLGGGGNTTTALLKLVQQTKTSVVIQSPYLVTTDLGKKLFKTTIDRKVSVKVMTNSLASTDNLQAFNGYQRDREALLKTGIQIYEYKPTAAVRYKLMTGALQKKMNFSPIFGLHAKTMVIDGRITVIGTFNLDPRSANLNTECVTIIYSEKIAQQVLKEIKEEMKPENCWETTLNFNPDKEAGLKKNVKMKAMRVVPKDIL
jgi:phosphatidylserine/phosphatidylglycerophosphate/cardiolipin synthase-like enzyme